MLRINAAYACQTVQCQESLSEDSTTAIYYTRWCIRLVTRPVTCNFSRICASEPGLYLAVCTGLTSNHFLDNTGDMRAAVSHANRYQALPLLSLFFVGARGEPGNEAGLEWTPHDVRNTTRNKFIIQKQTTMVHSLCRVCKFPSCMHFAVSMGV